MTKIQNSFSIPPNAQRSTVTGPGSSVIAAANAGVSPAAPSQGTSPAAPNPIADRARDFFIYEAALQAALGLSDDTVLLSIFAKDLGFAVSDSGPDSLPYNGPFPALPTDGIAGLFGSTSSN